MYVGHIHFVLMWYFICTAHYRNLNVHCQFIQQCEIIICIIEIVYISCIWCIFKLGQKNQISISYIENLEKKISQAIIDEI